MRRAYAHRVFNGRSFIVDGWCYLDFFASKPEFFIELMATSALDADTFSFHFSFFAITCKVRTEMNKWIWMVRWCETASNQSVLPPIRKKWELTKTKFAAFADAEKLTSAWIGSPSDGLSALVSFNDVIRFSVHEKTLYNRSSTFNRFSAIVFIFAWWNRCIRLADVWFAHVITGYSYIWHTIEYLAFHPCTSQNHVKSYFFIPLYLQQAYSRHMRLNIYSLLCFSISHMFVSCKYFQFAL